jgi:hypothetical protein
MPRATFCGFSWCHLFSNFKQNVASTTIEGLETFNLHQDIDYVVGRSGKKWVMRCRSNHQINGIILFISKWCQMVSLDKPAKLR